LAYAAGEDDPTPLVVDILPVHKRIGYDAKKTAVKIMDDDNRDIASFIITRMLNTCRALIIQGLDAKNILPSVFKSMGLVGVILSNKMIQHLVLDYKMTRAEYSMEGNFPMYLTFNKKTGKTSFTLTCQQIGSTLVRLDISLEGKLWTRVVHLLVSVFLKITGAKYPQEYFPAFITVDESVLSILNMKKGTSDHMELLHKSGQLSNVVISKAPCQIGSRNSHATDPGKPKGSHFIATKNRDSVLYADRISKEQRQIGGRNSHATDPGKPKCSHFIAMKNRDSIPSADRISKEQCQIGGRNSHATDPGKPKGSYILESENRDCISSSADRCSNAGKAHLGMPKSGSTEWYVTEEVNPIDNTRFFRERVSVCKHQNKSCSSTGFRGRCILVFILRCLHVLMDQGGE